MKVAPEVNRRNVSRCTSTFVHGKTDIAGMLVVNRIAGMLVVQCIVFAAESDAGQVLRVRVAAAGQCLGVASTSGAMTQKVCHLGETERKGSVAPLNIPPER